MAKKLARFCSAMFLLAAGSNLAPTAMAHRALAGKSRFD
jgi:hypothetical protein